MRKVGIAILFGITIALSFGCKGSSKTSGSGADGGPVLLKFDNGKTVTKSEFEYVYQKNNGGWDAVKKHTDAQYKEYLDLYIKFKRKVMAAEALGLHNTQSFINEFEGYRKQLAQPYLVEKKVQEDLIKEAYERSRHYVSASHILLRATPDDLPQDTLAALNRAKSLRDSILVHGKDFETLAKRHSQDPSAKKNAGFLGYFTVFDMVYPFETGAFNTPVGQVSEPVRSGYGYHLIKVHDKVESTGKKSVAHIIVRIGPQYSAKDTAMAKSRIKEIYDGLKNGGDFAKMAADYSDDGTTSKKGGLLGSGRLIQKMEEIKLKLGEGEISEPFNTDYGWHIMKVIEVDPIKSFDESKNEIKARIARDARSYLSREILIKRVKKEGNYTENKENLKKFGATFRDEDFGALNKGLWRPVDSLIGSLYNAEVYSIGSGDDKRTGTVRDMVTYYENDRKAMDGKTIDDVLRVWMQRFSEKEVLAYEESQLPKKYPEYRELVKEYRDGILLFTLTEDKVWRKAVEDTVGLAKYYEENPDSFMASERIVVTEYSAKNMTHLDSVAAMLKRGKNEQEIESAVNQGSSLNLRIRTLNYEKGKKEPETDLWGQKPGFTTGKLRSGDEYRIFVVKENLPAGLKTFEEARPECITLYQNHLEKTWNEELEKKYPVKVDEKQFEALYE